MRIVHLAAGIALIAAPALGQPFPNGAGPPSSEGYGADFSANQEAVTFGAAPTYTPAIAGQTLIATDPSRPSRRNCQVMNRSTDTLLVVFDDGAGTAPTVFSIGGAAASGGQGGALSCDEFKGRVSVFGPVGTDKVAMRDN
jgi:hypothetical protein